MPYTRHAYFLVFDGFDDHGVSLALRALRASAGLEVIVAGIDGGPAVSASGLRVMPDIDCADIDLARAGLFLLPAGELWSQAERNAPLDCITACVTEMLRDFDAAGVRIAAAGSAVATLARAGLLDGVSHTGDGPRRLAAALPRFEASPFYVHTAAISDQNIITANGRAGVALAAEIVRELDIRDPHPPPSQQAA